MFIRDNEIRARWRKTPIFEIFKRNWARNRVGFNPWICLHDENLCRNLQRRLESKSGTRVSCVANASASIGESCRGSMLAYETSRQTANVRRDCAFQRIGDASGSSRRVLSPYRKSKQHDTPRLVCQKEDIIKRNNAEAIRTRSAPSITVVRYRRCYTRRRVIIYININKYILYSCVMKRNENARRRE